MGDSYKYGVACAPDSPSREAPIILRGEIERVAETAREIGYDGLELQICDPGRLDARRFAAVARQAGLEYSAIATGRELIENGLSLISDDAGIRRAAVDRLKEHVDLAAALGGGCMVIVGTMRSKIADFSRYAYYEDLLTGAKRELADYAEGKGVRLLVENILKGISNYLNTMREVTDYVKRLGRGNVGVHLDTYSMLAEDRDIAACVRYCADRLEYVHFSDSGRYYPGAGNVDFKAFLHALADVGYRGWIATECVPVPTEYDCAKRGLDYIKALETVVDIERSLPR